MPGRYKLPVQMAAQIPVFPLGGVIMLPRAQLPLNIFEPRYLAMIDHVMATDRLLGIVQPARDPGEGAEIDGGTSPQGKSRGVRRIGSVGRLTAYQETDDGRYIISLTGVSRMVIGEEIETEHAFRMFNVKYDAFAQDLSEDHTSETVDRDHLLKALKDYLTANQMSADWSAIAQASTEFLVNTLAMICPYGNEEKQALLEAETLSERAQVLIALAEMDIASKDEGGSTTLQ